MLKIGLFRQTSLPIGAFATTLTTLSLSLMEWRGVTTTNVYVANFFFLAAMGLVVSAQWELAAGNGLAYSIYSAFGELNPQQAYVLAPHHSLIRFFLRWLRGPAHALVWDICCVRGRHSAI